MMGVTRNKIIFKHIMIDTQIIVAAVVKKRFKSKKFISKFKSKKNTLLLDNQIDIIEYNPFFIIKKKIIIISIKSAIYTINIDIL